MIVLAIFAALFLVSAGMFATTALAAWWLDVAMGFDKFGVSAWMAGAFGVIAPMYLGTLAIALFAFVGLSGISV